MLVLAGLTGAGKTERLHALAAAGEQVLDLEALAEHRGSSFGSIGLGPQPDPRAFARRVRERLARADPERPLWVEDEGPFIGSVGVPPDLLAAIRRAPVLVCSATLEERVARLLAIYGDSPADELLSALERCRRRLGPTRTDAAATHVRRGDVDQAIALVLPYFDAAYKHRMAGSPRPKLTLPLRQLSRRGTK